MTGPAGPVRAAEARDLAALVALEERVFDTDALDRRAFRHAIRSPTVTILVVNEGGVLRGYGIVEFRRGSGIARLSSLAVAPDAAGRGIGRRLLAALEEDARAQGRGRVRLEVRADNPRAAALYERAGYARLGEVAEYYEDGAAALRFEKRLNAGIEPRRPA